MSLLLAVLGVFFIWETLQLSPWTIPSWLQPGLVYGVSLLYVWPDWRLALAVSGAVGLLHVVVVGRSAPTGGVQAIQRPSRTPRIPTLP